MGKTNFATCSTGRISGNEQRISVRLAIVALSEAEVKQYLRFRWTKAGATKPLPFAAEAIPEIAQLAQGIPRVINSLCDNALMLAFGEGLFEVSAHHVREAAQDLDLIEKKVSLPEAPLPVSPEPVPLPVEMAPLRALERYGADNSKPSLWMKWATKLGLAN